jgi:5-methylcytosine-specific restriction endonuclease McrA
MTRRGYVNRNQWRTSTRAAVLAKTGGCCALCGSTGSDGRGKGLHLAHLVPHPIGPDDQTNLVPLCAGCHASFDGKRR